MLLTCYLALHIHNHIHTYIHLVSYLYLRLSVSGSHFQMLFRFVWPDCSLSVACALSCHISCIALRGYTIVKVPVKIFLPCLPFSWDSIISDTIFGDFSMLSFTFHIYLGTSWTWPIGEDRFALESVAIQAVCRQDGNKILGRVEH